jgi:ketopantoate reductase
MTQANPRRVLLVGAGAVGQVYGHHLRRGGAEVTYLIKERHRSAVEEGFILHRHRLLRRPQTARFDDFDVIVDYERVARAPWDQVWLCVSSPALAGEWLEDLVGRIGEATLVSLQPGVHDRERLEAIYPADRIVSGMISLIAYQAPLENEDLSPGTAYLLPPLAPSPFQGPAERTAAVVEALDHGGCPAKVDPDTLVNAAFGSALLMPAIAALEAASWSLSRYRKSIALEVSTLAAKEALGVMGLYHWKSPPLALRTARRPELFGLGLSLAPRLLPFDLEAYLAYHFTKTADQTRQMLDEYIALGERQAVGLRALPLLRRLLDGEEIDAVASLAGKERVAEPTR